MEEADGVLTITNGFTEEEFRQLLTALAQKQTDRKEVREL